MNKRHAAAVICVMMMVPVIAGAWYYQSQHAAPSTSGTGKTGKDKNPKIPTVDPAGLAGNIVLGRPTDSSITANLLAEDGTEAYMEYGTASGTYTGRTATKSSSGGKPIELTMDGLKADTQYFYRAATRQSGQSGFTAGAECSFRTQRAPGSTFVFGVQGDSHPERPTKMFNAGLYNLTMDNVAKDSPDLYFTLGDDFSIESLIDKNAVNEKNAANIYLNQRQYLGRIGTNTSLFLVNGNHEQAAKYLLDGTASSPPVVAGNARVRYYPLPAPDGFYTGDNETVEHLGLPRDYYAFTWGDALFVTLDFYWHSPVPVDNVAGNDSAKRSNLWDITLGEAQYNWFRQTLASSTAKYKFVFTHHVLGTGRGGVEGADGYEWGGKGGSGVYEFDTKRPGWEAPIHQLMVKYNVTIFFSGHDHIFAHQQKDGVTYQSVQNPADNTYTAFNKDAYKSGDIFPNSGHLRVTVSPQQVKVDYVRSWLPSDEAGGHKNGEVAFSYTITK